MIYFHRKVRASVRLFSILVLALLFAGAALRPNRLQAQPEPSAASTSAAPAETPKAGEGGAEGKKSEADEDAKYLQGPVVKWAAGVLHVSTPTASLIFLVFNFAIIVFGLGIPLVRAFPRIIRKRSATLSGELAEARKATADAQARLSAVEAQLARFDDEIAAIRARVAEESKQDEARIKASLAVESERIVASAEQEIGVAAAQARRELRHFAADLAIEQAARQLVLTPEADRALIAEFVSDAAKGGTN